MYTSSFAAHQFIFRRLDKVRLFSQKSFIFNFNNKIEFQVPT